MKTVVYTITFLLFAFAVIVGAASLVHDPAYVASAPTPICAGHLPVIQEVDAEPMRQIDLELKQLVTHRSSGTGICLPVVFHVMHDNGPENVSDAKILTALSNLNDAFANTRFYNQGTGVDTEISFCLAVQNPEQEHTDGINRTQTTLTDFVVEDSDSDLKKLSGWPPRSYINIWIVREVRSKDDERNLNLAGYAYLPSSHGTPNDGIVIEARLLEDAANTSILVHEMGHYLGLYHTYRRGCPNNDCEVDGDAVCDTPPDNSTAIIPCDLSSNSCNTDKDDWFPSDRDDLTNNYMDLSDVQCYNAFTAGQKTRMATLINFKRGSLLTSKGCSLPCIPAITTNPIEGSYEIVIGEQAPINLGATNVSEIAWLIDGQEIGQGAVLQHIFSEEGVFDLDIKLTGNNTDCTLFLSTQVVVNCNVVAEFEVNASYFHPGDEGTFYNSSENFTQVQWIFGGQPVSTNLDSYSTNFDTTGVYEVCLEATNGFCEVDFCKNILVVDTSADCRVYSSLQIGWDGVVIDMEFYEQGYMALCQLGGYTSIVYFDLEFNQLRNYGLGKIDFSGSGYIHIDGQELFVVLAQNKEARIFKFDLTKEDFVWDKRVVHPENQMQVQKPILKTNELLLPFTSSNTSNFRAFLALNRSDGTVTNAIALKGEDRIKLSHHSLIADAIYDAGVSNNNHLDQRDELTLTKFDADNEMLWSYYYRKPSSIVSSSTIMNRSNSAMQAISEGLLVVGLQHASNTDQSIYLTTLDLEGNILSNKNISMAGGEIESCHTILPYQNRYLLLGTAQKDNGFKLNFVATLSRSGQVENAFLIEHHIVRELRDAEVIGPYLMMSGSVRWPSTSVPIPLVINLKLPLSQQSSCEDLIPVEFIVTESILERIELPLEPTTFEYTIDDVDSELVDKFIRERRFCYTLCDELCDNGIDDNEDGLIDCEDPVLAAGCCCAEKHPLELGEDKLICPNEEVHIVAPAFYESYLWSDGSTGSDYITSAAGMVWVEVADSCNVYRDTIMIEINEQQLLDLGPDTEVCNFVQSWNMSGYESYFWYHNDKQVNCGDCASMDIELTEGDNVIQVFGTSQYGCISSDTILMTLETNSIQYDYSICDALPLELLGGTYLMGGEYLTQEVEDNGCDRKVELFISEKSVYIPNTFSLSALSPDNILTPQLTCPVQNYSFSIYDRWGNKVFYSEDPNTGWNGNIKRYTASQGVYTYMMTFDLEEYDASFIKSGMVTLIR